MIWLLASLMTALASPPAEITITDARVKAVDVVCSTGTERFSVRDGKVELKAVPKGCTVELVLSAGKIDGAGKFTCTLDDCRMDEIMHKPVSNGPGKLNVIVVPGTEVTDFEVKCPGGYRERSKIEENVALFSNVPKEECELYYKGGFPGKFRPISEGTWQCGQVGNVAVCKKK